MTDWYKIKRILVRQNNQEKQIYPASRLPSAYQEVEYIQSSWTQYINSWFNPTWNSELEIDFEYTSIVSNPVSTTWCFWIDSWWSVSAFSVFADRMFCYGSQYQAVYNYYYTAGTRYVFQFKNLKWYLNGTKKFTYTKETFTSSYPALIFAKWRNNGIETYSNTKIYGVKLWDNWVLQREFVPCYRKSDSVIWMYDLANNQFYTNSWSWTFTKWPNVS